MILKGISNGFRRHISNRALTKNLKGINNNGKIIYNYFSTKKSEEGIIKTLDLIEDKDLKLPEINIEQEREWLLEQKTMGGKDLDPITEKELEEMYLELITNNSQVDLFTREKKEQTLNQIFSKINGQDMEKDLSIREDKKLTKEKLLDHLKTIAEQFKKKDITLGVFNSLIHIYSVYKQENNVLLAMELMKEMGIKPNERTYTFAMNLYANKMDLENCIKYFKILESEDLPITHHPYGVLIKAYSNLGRVQDAFDVYEIIKSKGLNIEQPIVCTLISACVNAGQFDRAWKTFDHMRLNICQPDTVTYNYMISICFKQGMVEKAFNLYDLMKEEGVQMSLTTYNTLIQACSTNKEYYNEALKLLKILTEDGFKPDYYTLIALMLNAQKSKNLLDARKLFSKILEMFPNSQEISSAFNSIFFIYATQFNVSRNENHFKEGAGQLNRSEIIKLLQGSIPKASKEAIKEAEILYQFYKATYFGLTNSIDKKRVSHSFLCLHSNYGNFNRAMEIYNEYQINEDNGSTQLDTHLIMIQLCFRLKKKEEFFNIFERIKSILAPLQSKSGLSFLEKNAYKKENNINDKMLSETYFTLINALSRMGELELSMNLLRAFYEDTTLKKYIKLDELKWTYYAINEAERVDLKMEMLQMVPNTKDQSLHRSKSRLAKKWNNSSKKLEISKTRRILDQEKYDAQLL